MGKGKKLLSLVLATVMVFGMIPMTVAFAEDGTEWEVSVQEELTEEIPQEETEVQENTENSEPSEEVQLPEISEEEIIVPEVSENDESINDSAEESDATESDVQNESEDTEDAEALSEESEVSTTPESENQIKNEAETEKKTESAPLTAAADLSLNETIELNAGSDIFTPGNLGSSEFGNVKEMFKGNEIEYNGYQLMEIKITVPVQAGLEVTAVKPATEGLYPEYSKLEKGADAYTYSYYCRENGTYSFTVEYTVNGAPAEKSVEYTMEDMFYIPDIIMRAYLLQAIDPNKYNGYITKTDVTEGRYYLSETNYTSGNMINPGGYGGPDYYFSHVKNPEGIQYMTTMSDICFYSSYLYKNPIDLQTLEPLTKGYYPNMTRFQFTSPYDSDSKVSPDAYTSEMLGRVIEKMPNLVDFYANKVGFVNFEAFGKLNGKLNSVSCKQSNVTSIKGLENHTGLAHISLNVNNISDITPLANITNAGTWNFIQNNISDLTPIKNVKVSNQIHFGYQSVYPEPADALLKDDVYEIELPMPIDIDGSSTKVGFASFLTSALGSKVPVEQRDKLLVVFEDNTRHLYPVSERDGKIYAEIPKADVPNGGTDAAFKNSKMRFWFENDNGSDGRTRGAFNGNVDFTVVPKGNSAADTYTVKFDKNNSNAKGEMAPQELRRDAYDVLTEYGFTMKNGRFVGWNTKPDGTGTAFRDREGVKNLADAGGEITLYAQWEVHVSYSWLDKDGPGGTVIPPHELVELPSGDWVKIGTAFTAQKLTYDSDEYVFHGWFTDDEFKNEYVDGTVVTEPFELIGKWTFNEKEFTVDYKFVSEDGTTKLPKEVMDKLPAQITAKRGDTVSIPVDLVFEDVKTNEGTWKFTGWDKTEIADISADDSFTGTWKFTADEASENNAPEITAEDTVINANDEFDPLEGVSAYDKEDGDITHKLEVAYSNVDTSKAGNYEVTYKVTDKDGNTVTKTIKVTVKDKDVVVPDNNKPSKPDKPSTSDNKPSVSNKPAQTGDNSNIIMWTMICLAAFGGMMVTVIVTRKKRNSRK